jgi:outer membrane protein OmpA-like peptidoglycan-associated protein
MQRKQHGQGRRHRGRCRSRDRRSDREPDRQHRCGCDYRGGCRGDSQNDIKDAKVERVGEGIKITFNSGILFAFNSADLQPEAKTNIENLANTLKKYKDTNILVEGHTDSVGTADYNVKLSERRAQTVVQFAESLGVKASRFTAKGYGFTQPVATNATPEGRQQNRRVEVAIMANDDLKKAAERNQVKVP